MSEKTTYEIMFITPANFTEKQKKDAVASIKKTLEDKKSEVIFEDLTWGDRLLAYPIKKHEYGYYGVLVFKTEPKHIQDIEKTLLLNESILRSLISKVETQDINFKKYADVKTNMDFVTKQ